MAAVDLKKVYREHYAATAVPSLVTVPERPFLMVDGHGDPNTSPAYRDAVETLYPLAYAVRATVRTATGDAYTVMPLEGLWWVDDMRTFSVHDKSAWEWTLMICLPDAVARVPVDDVVAEVSRARGLPGTARVERFAEGRAAQVLHVGPYSAEEPTVAALHSFIAGQGLTMTGRHHEIYLSDARRTDPSRLRTIVRQPVAAR